jgi:hypothetical protein
MSMGVQHDFPMLFDRVGANMSHRVMRSQLQRYFQFVLALRWQYRDILRDVVLVRDPFATMFGLLSRAVAPAVSYMKAL